jgi:DNA-directed RNA polymerase specialized sigma24 family protein
MKEPDDTVSADLLTAEGFVEFYLRYGPRLLRFLVAQGVPKDEAEHLYQDAFVVLWRRRDATAITVRFLYGVTRLLLLAWRPRNCVKLVSLDGFGDDDAQLGIPPEPAPPASRLSAWLNRALALLTRRQRAAVEGVLLDGQPRCDIAARLGISEGALRYHEYMALKRLRDQPPDAAARDLRTARPKTKH